MHLSITLNPAPSAKMYFGLWRFLYSNLWPARSFCGFYTDRTRFCSCAVVVMNEDSYYKMTQSRVIDVIIMSPCTIISRLSWILRNRCSSTEELISEEGSKSQQNGTFTPETNRVLIFTHHWTLLLDLLTTFQCVCGCVCTIIGVVRIKTHSHSTNEHPNIHNS